MYTLSTEFVGVSHRHISGSMIWIGWALTIMLLAGIAYFFHNWRHVTLVGAVPGLLIVVFWWYVSCLYMKQNWSFVKYILNNVQIIIIIIKFIKKIEFHPHSGYS